MLSLAIGAQRHGSGQEVSFSDVGSGRIVGKNRKLSRNGLLGSKTDHFKFDGETMSMDKTVSQRSAEFILQKHGLLDRIID